VNCFAPPPGCHGIATASSGALDDRQAIQAPQNRLTTKRAGGLNRTSANSIVNRSAHPRHHQLESSAIPVPAAAAAWSSSRPSSAAAPRDIGRQSRSGSTHHDRRHPIITPERCSHLLAVNQPRGHSANNNSRVSAHTLGDADPNSIMAPARSVIATSRGGPSPAITTTTPHPTARSSQIPIVSARGTVVPMPTRGFLP